MSGLNPEANRLGLPLMAQVLSDGKWRPYPYLKFLAGKICSSIMSGNGRIIVNLPPRHGKSELVSKYLPLWFLNWFPDKQVILASYQAEFAAEWSRKCRNLAAAKSDELDFKIASDLTRSDNWQTTKGGGMYSAGAGGAITGRGGHLIIVDDPVKNWEDAHSSAVKRRTNDWFDSTLITRAEPGSTVIVIMTRWSEDDLTAHLMKMGGWTQYVLPAVAETDDILGRAEGEPLCPARYDRVALEEIKLYSTGSYKFAAIYQQRPAPMEGGLWKRSWFEKRWRVAPGEFDSQLQSWDLSFGSTSDESSYVVGQVWGRCGSVKYLLDQTRFKGGFNEQLSAIRRRAAKWPNARPILVEDKANGRAALDVLKLEISGLLPYSPHGSKEIRAQAVSPQLEAGDIVLPHPEIAPWVGDYVEECATFPNGAYDDQVDATSQALLRFAENYDGPILCG